MQKLSYSITMLMLIILSCQYQIISGMATGPTRSTINLLGKLPIPLRQWGNIIQIRSVRQSDRVSCGYFTTFNAHIINNAVREEQLIRSEHYYHDQMNTLRANANLYPWVRHQLEEDEIFLFAQRIGLNNFTTLKINTGENIISLNRDFPINLDGTYREPDNDQKQVYRDTYGIEIGIDQFNAIINSARQDPIHHFFCLINSTRPRLDSSGNPILDSSKNNQPIIDTSAHWVLLTVLRDDQTIILMDSVNGKFSQNEHSRVIINRYTEFINRIILDIDTTQPIAPRFIVETDDTDDFILSTDIIIAGALGATLVTWLLWKPIKKATLAFYAKFNKGLSPFKKRLTKVSHKP